MAYKWLNRKWPARKPVWMIMFPELAGLVGTLVLFGIAQPDSYRTLLWKIGFDNGFNSDPLIDLYAAANYQPQPATPFVWSQTLTNFNVAISVVTLFILLVKMIAWIMHVWFPIVALGINAGMTILWTVSVYGQMGPDYADPRYPSPIAWYIAKSCDYAIPYGALKSCEMAKGTFAVSVYMLFLYTFNLGIAIWAMWPNKRNDVEDDDDESTVGVKESKPWEMQNMNSVPATPRTLPYTPRTTAFQTLDRKLPLRYN